jgi:hypothetical protein
VARGEAGAAFIGRRHRLTPEALSEAIEQLRLQPMQVDDGPKFATLTHF